MKNLLKISLVMFVVVFAFTHCAPHSLSDDEIRSKVVKLSSSRGSCSGQQVKALSGTNYILSAGHCSILEENGSIRVSTEDGRVLNRRIIAEDPASDLLLLEGIPNMEGLRIGKDLSRLEHVRTFTHGKGLSTYMTEGDIIQDYTIEILVGSAADCPNYPKFKIEHVDMGFMQADACILSIPETVTTAKIVPGSSGGAIVNSLGELVGVASATDGVFGYIVKLSDIQSFMSNY